MPASTLSKRSFVFFLLTAILSTGRLPFVGRLWAGDWPTWRYDAARTAASPSILPQELFLHWTIQLPDPMPAWPASQPKLDFDRRYEPVAAGRFLLVGSTVSECVTALDTRTGEQKWVFHAEGPVRFAPAIDGERVYVTSDDGHLYCLELETGKKQWAVPGGPERRQIIGNDRLISMWPCRGGVVVKDSVAYFAAGIWPSMGIFIRAVDARSGEEIWTNSSTGSRWVRHPHGADAFGSISPQGYLAISGDNLIVPGGRTLPGVFDLKTGRLKHFEFGGKGEGGHDVFSSGQLMHVRGAALRISDGKSVGRIPASFVGRGIAGLDGSKLVVVDPAAPIKEETVKDRKGKEIRKLTWQPERRETFELNGPSRRVFIEAGDQFFAGEPGRIAAYRYSESPGPLDPLWVHNTDGDSEKATSEPVSMITADDRLFVVTSDSRLLCFGPEKVSDAANVSRKTEADELLPVSGNHLPLPIDLSDEKFQAGYAVVLAPPSRESLRQLLDKTRLHLLCYQRPEDSEFRRALWKHHLSGRRFTFRGGRFHDTEQPPYFASLVYSDILRTYGPDEVLQVVRSLRPYGGECWLATEPSGHSAIESAIKDSDSEISRQFTISREGHWTRIRRPGPLPDSGLWTHQYGDSSNSVVSTDKRVKAPLGLLWFGGPSNDRVLPRHGHGPSPQVAGGRLFIEGADMLRCVDVYTGRVWWERELPGLGTFYDNTSHQPGAGEIGSNYVSLEDRVYVIHKDRLLALDARTGETAHEFTTATVPGARIQEEHWGVVLAEDDLLITAASPVAIAPSQKETTRQRTVRPRSVPENTIALIRPQAEWKYLAGSDPPATWTRLDFDDSKWPAGQAGFGYGDDDDVTVLDMKGKYSRVYLRREFSLPEEIGTEEIKRLGGQLQLLLKYDDAFIAYLNGREFARVGVGSGRGAQASSITGHEAKDYGMWVPEDGSRLIRPGKNVLAIEGHNAGADSSDFTLDPLLLVSDYGDLKDVLEAAEEKKSAEIAEARKTIMQIPLLRDVLRQAQYSSASQFLSVFDRHSGESHWARSAEYSFRHNAICVADGRVYCIDAFSPAKLAALKRRGIKPDGKPKLLCLDARSGKEIWSTDENVFGTFLSYSREHGMLIQAGSAYRDRAKDEVDTGLVAYDGRTGQVLWEDRKLKYGGPLLIHHDRLITNGGGGFEIDLKTGKTTGWKYSRMYGCNTAVGSEHLLTFRSGAAGFCDLLSDSGTGNLGGFRSSCTSNLIPADGVLNAPDYTRTCSCAYQLQTSLALIHMPEAESWTFGNESFFSQPVREFGLNLGGPGDRRDRSGTLWFDCPSVGGPGPQIDIQFEPASPQRFIQHASLIQPEEETATGAPTWIGASGLLGIRKAKLKVKRPDRDHDEVRISLTFGLPPGESWKTDPRIFSVAVNGRTLETDMNLNEKAQSRKRLESPATRRARSVSVSTRLTVPEEVLEIEISLTPKEGSRETVLSGIQIKFEK